MDDITSNEVTNLLIALRSGDQAALDKLFSSTLIGIELKKLAKAILSHEYRANHTLQPTALINEVYLKLAKQKKIDLVNRRHFFAIAARLMRQILVDHAKEKKAQKRGGEFEKISLDEIGEIFYQQDIDIEVLDQALNKLEEFNSFGCRIVEMRYFAGLTIEETAKELEVAPATVKRKWEIVRIWLWNELRGTK